MYPRVISSPAVMDRSANTSSWMIAFGWQERLKPRNRLHPRARAVWASSNTLPYGMFTVANTPYPCILLFRTSITLGTSGTSAPSARFHPAYE
jgi:hypothetical protein